MSQYLKLYYDNTTLISRTHNEESNFPENNCRGKSVAKHRNWFEIDSWLIVGVLRELDIPNRIFLHRTNGVANFKI